MLSDQHKFVTSLLNPQYLQEYRSHMCGVCHALGRGYHLPARMLTSHDLVLLSILSEAQSSQPFKTTLQQCPISLMKSSPSIADTSVEYSAAVGVVLAGLKLDDDADDEPRQRALIRIVKSLTRKLTLRAESIASSLGVTGSMWASFHSLQSSVEKSETFAPDEPTALLSQSLFEGTATLASSPENRPTLRQMGYQYGRYIYWMDAFRDFPKDYAAGRFNPLFKFAFKSDFGYGISTEGIRYLLGLFGEIRHSLAASLDQLILIRHQELLHTLIMKPLDEIIDAVDARMQQSESFSFRRFSVMDIARAGLFLLPAVVVTATTVGDTDNLIGNVDGCVKSTQTWINSVPSNGHVDLRMLGFGLGSLDWIRDILPGMTEIGDGPGTAICNGPCAGICEATDPTACCRPNPDVGSNCWTCGGSGCLNACETLF